MGVKGREAWRFTFKGRLFYICPTSQLNFLHSIWYPLSHDCMDLEFYPLTVKNHYRLFEFESVSDSKRILKRVVFRAIPGTPDIHNLALIDVLENNVTSDIEISNNADMPKVMSTVIHCLLRFLDHYPTATVYMEGNSSSRNRLYRAVISREISKVKNFLEIYGRNERDFEPFQPGIPYTSFLIKQKTL